MKPNFFFNSIKEIYTCIEYKSPTTETIIKLLSDKKNELVANNKTRFFSVCKNNNLSDLEQWLLFLVSCFEIEPAIIHEISKNCANKNYLSFNLIAKFIYKIEYIPLNSILFREKFIYIDKSGFALIDSSLRISENVIGFLLEVNSNNQKLEALIKPTLALNLPFLRNFYPIIDPLITNLLKKEKVSLLLGKDELLQETIVLQLKEHLIQDILFIDVNYLPDKPDELDTCIRFLRTETLLKNVIYCFSFHNFEKNSEENKLFILRFINLSYKFLMGHYLILSNYDFTDLHFSLHKITITKLNSEALKLLWKHFLANNFECYSHELNNIIEYFELTLGKIKNISEETTNSLNEANQPIKSLWNLCREYTRDHTSNLCVSLKTQSQWEQLVLPKRQKEQLEQLIAQVKNRTLIYREWGLANNQTRGLGITALFFGSSGTGKTMAAEAIAEQLKLDLYRIDLSQVISKYIGETQKNLEKVFLLAEKSFAILLFDEADSLFAKRAETKDSRDRYSNMEVSYLLTRMENYRGVSLLTTNLKGNIDNAFLRRFRFVVEFFYPSEIQRVQLWDKLLNRQIPREMFDIKKLAKIDINAASIRSVLMHAAFFAAETKRKQLTLQHLKKAIQQEFIKLERPLTEAINAL